MILHIVSRSPFQHDALARCHAALSSGDALLLIEDGVLALAAAAKFLKPLAPHTIYVLMADAEARGLDIASDSGSDIQPVDYAGFVDLVARFDKTLSWF